MRRTSLVLALIASAAALMLSGCGEGDSTADTTAEITKAAFVKQANAICAKTNQALVKAAEDFSKEKSLSAEQSLNDAQIGELTKLVLPTIVTQFEEMRALGVPAGEEKEVNAILSAADKAIEEAEADSSVIFGADGGAFAKANRLSAEYGLKKCSE